MRVDILIAFALAVTSLQPTPEMKDLMGKINDLHSQIKAEGKQFQSPAVWQDQTGTKINEISSKISDLSKQLEADKHTYKQMKKEEKKAEKAAAKAAAAAAATASVSTDAPASSDAPATQAEDDIALTPEKLLFVLAAAESDTEAALKKQIKKLQKKIEQLGQDFGDSSTYSNMTKIQSLVAEINDDQKELSADLKKLKEMKAAAKAAKKEAKAAAAAAASTTAAPSETTETAPETTEAAPETTEAAPETSESAPETTEAAPETSEATAADDTKAPMMLLAVDSEPSLALSWVVLFGSLATAGLYFAYRRLNGKLNMSELRPLLKKDEYFSGEYAA